MKKWTDSEISLVKDLALQGASYKDIAKDLNRSPKSVRLKMHKIGFLLRDVMHKEARFCRYCQAPISSSTKVFCSQSCAAKSNNRKRLSSKPEKICPVCQKQIKGKNNKRFCSAKCHKEYLWEKWIGLWKTGDKRGFSGKGFKVANAIRKYLFEKYESKCCLCGWSEINAASGKIPLQVDHIDGDAANNKEENLRLLCPNCHSLTPNFGALNRGSCRRHRPTDVGRL
jgi:predicted nucleic acid-binding Zn ribbon protein